MLIALTLPSHAIPSVARDLVCNVWQSEGHPVCIVISCLVIRPSQQTAVFLYIPIPNASTRFFIFPSVLPPCSDEKSSWLPQSSSYPIAHECNVRFATDTVVKDNYRKNIVMTVQIYCAIHNNINSMSVFLSRL